MQQLLTENTLSVESALSSGQNGYLRLVFPPDQYDRIVATLFVRLPDPGRTATSPTWKTPGEKKHIIRENRDDRHMYDDYREVDTDLKNQLVYVFQDA